MNPTHAVFLIGLLVVCLPVPGSAQPSAGSNGFSELDRAQVPDSRDLEVVMGIVERTGESVSAKHYHPGGEFGLILEGTVTVTTEGTEKTTFSIGDNFHQSPGEWHIVSTPTEGARTVVFRIVKKGQPMIVEVE